RARCRRCICSTHLPGMTSSRPGSRVSSGTIINQLALAIMKNVSVIGAGTMGNGIAHVFAQKGFTVSLVDTQPQQLEKAVRTIAQNLDRQIAKGLVPDEEKQATLGRITTHSNIAAGVEKADLVVEAATENADLK